MNPFRNTLASSIIGLAVFSSSALPVFAQANPADAAQITNCSQAGRVPVAVGASVGVAQGSGIFVPVADQAVITNSNLTVQNTSKIIFNTGMLVYKECTLREIVDAQRKAATALIVRNGTVAFATGRNGGPLFPQKRQPEKLFLASDPQILLDFSRGAFDAVHPLYKSRVQRAVGQGYFADTRKPNDELACSYTGDLNAALRGHPTGSTVDALLAMGTMACNPVLVAETAYEREIQRTSAAVQDLDTAVSEGQGIYPKLKLDDNGNYVFTSDTEITTPASFVRDMEEQLLTSGLRQQESANNVNEMVTTLFSEVGTQIISSDQGFGGLFQPTSPSGGQAGSGPSFLDRVVSQSGGQLITTTGNAALQLLNAALAIERSYNQAVSATAANLAQTIAQLRAVERQCWVSLTQNVCAPGTLSAGGKSCTGVSGNSLTRIATSTVFSQAVVTNQIAPLANSTAANIAKSNIAITQLSQFIATITANPSTQAAVLAQFNRLSGLGAFHTSSDLTAAQAQQVSVTAATAILVQNTINIWAGTDSAGGSTIPWDSSINPGTGWCNFQNATTLNLWDQQWR